MWVVLAMLPCRMVSAEEPEPAPSLSTPTPPPPPPPPEPGLGPPEESPDGLLFGSSDLGAEVHGFVNLELYAFEHRGEDNGPSFDIHNVFLSTRAHIGSSASVFVELEYEHGATLKLDRGFFEYQVAAPFTIRFGRFTVPFSYERMHYAAPVRLMTSRPYAVDVGFHEWTDTGIEAFGSIDWFSYDLCLLNGPRGLTEAGIPNLDVIDNNIGKTVVARLNVAPAPWLTTGVAASMGPYDPADERWIYLAELDVHLQTGPLDILAEVDARTGADEPCSVAADASCDPAWLGGTASKVGYYVTAAYSLIQGVPYVHYLKPVVRYDELDVLPAKGALRRVAAGLNWSPAAHIVLKSEVQWTFPSDRALDGSRGVMASAVADF